MSLSIPRPDALPNTLTWIGTRVVPKLHDQNVRILDADDFSGRKIRRPITNILRDSGFTAYISMAPVNGTDHRWTTSETGVYGINLVKGMMYRYGLPFNCTEDIHTSPSIIDNRWAFIDRSAIRGVLHTEDRIIPNYRYMSRYFWSTNSPVQLVVKDPDEIVDVINNLEDILVEMKLVGYDDNILVGESNRERMKRTFTG